MSDLSALVTQTYDAYGEVFRPAMRQAAQELPQRWGLLWVFLEYEPEPVSLAKLAEFSPYTAPARHAEWLETFASAGYLTPVEPGVYRLTDSARQQVGAVIDALYDFVVGLDFIEPHLADLLGNVVERALKATIPTPILSRNHHSDRGIDAAAPYRILQYLTDLQSFRDDCYIRAWQAHQVEGYVWEAFTFIWQGEANTPDALAEKLEARGYTADDYAAACHQLVERGWIAGTPDAYTLTAAGKALRESVEAETDRLYEQPWGEDTGALIPLLTSFQESMTITS